MDTETIRRQIAATVHEEYYLRDTNCATVTLMCLSGLFGVPLTDQVIAAAQGMHGAGGYRAQCGLAEGGLMFLGIYGAQQGLSREKTVELCRDYAQRFEQKFGSLRCRELRPGGFRADDPPHLCEELTCRAILFSAEYVYVAFQTGRESE